MLTIRVRVVDSAYRAVESARLSAADARGPVVFRFETDRWIAERVAPGRMTIRVLADGFEPEAHAFTARDEVTRVLIALRRPGELSFSYGSGRLAFKPSARSLILHVRGKGAGKAIAARARRRKIAWKNVSPRSASAEDEAFVQCEGGIKAVRGLADSLVRAKLDVRVARVVARGGRLPLGLLAELVVRFKGDVTRLEAERIAAGAGLRIAREVRHAGNAYLLVREGEPSYDVLKAADALQAHERVEHAEPNLLYPVELDAHVPNDPLWPSVPHLVLINADDAWDRLDDVAINLRGGSPGVTIAIVDPEGVAPNHPDLTAGLTDGTGKLLADVNFAVTPIVPQTPQGLQQSHGTQCAGSATAAFDDNRGLPGVAPNCHLIGARINRAAMDDVLLADVCLWAAGFLNGNATPGFPVATPTQAADVISISWGRDADSLSEEMRACFDFLTTYGRGGKGCLLCFSIGNNGYVDFTDDAGAHFRAWPAYARTIAVGSSINVNPTNPVPASKHADPNGRTVNIPVAVDTRALYSPYGLEAPRKPDLVSPSHTATKPDEGYEDPIMAAVRVNKGNVDGCPGSAVCNDYAKTFGGTSHSTPTVAGAIALILSARPDLSWIQVREILRQSCVQIDAAQTDAIGRWQDLDGDGSIDHSCWYGAGRLDVDAAVAMALAANLRLADVYVRENLADVGDVPSGGTWWESPDIWVRQDPTEAVPALAWANAPPHQNAKRGQDNAVFCRVRNRGQAPARILYVRAMIASWPGLDFQYPADFQPSANVGGTIPSPLVRGTYLIGEAPITDLAPGADRIVKLIWPAALVPPETVSVSGTDVHWHPCLLLEASPHDGPNPIAGPLAAVRGDNNIAQRNITIQNPADADADAFAGFVAGTRHDAGVAALVFDTSRMRGATSLCVRAADDLAMERLAAALSGEARTSSLKVALIEHRGVAAIEIRGLQGQLEIPFALAAGQQALLMAAVPGSASGDLWISQRRGDGIASAGYGIRRAIP